MVKEKKMILNVCIKNNTMVDENICKSCKENCRHAGQPNTKDMLDKVLRFTPKGTSQNGSLVQAGTQGYTFSVEIEIADANSSTGKICYSWAMPVYQDAAGKYIDFSNTALKAYYGKIYLNNIGKIKKERTRKNSQVALVAWEQGRGFAHEPLTYVSEVHFFNSKKDADEFLLDDWYARNCPMYPVDIPMYDDSGKFIGFSMEERPDYRFQRVQRRTKSWMYAEEGYVQEMSPAELEAWCR